MDLANLPKLQIRFAPPFAKPNIAIVCNPPFPEVNLIFAAVASARIRPYAMAIEQKAVAKNTALKIYAQAYAEGVIDHCDQAPYDKYTIPDWERWLMEHKDHFSELRALVDHKPNWKAAYPLEDFDGVHGYQDPGSAAG